MTPQEISTLPEPLRKAAEYLQKYGFLQGDDAQLTLEEIVKDRATIARLREALNMAKVVIETCTKEGQFQWALNDIVAALSRSEGGK